MFNSVNRSHVAAHVGAVAATIEVGLIHAHKKMIVRNLSMVDMALIAASGANYVTMTALIDGAAVAATVVDTQAGLAARAPLETGLPSDGLTSGEGITLEKGEVLSVNLVVTAGGALTNASLHADCEIIGN